MSKPQGGTSVSQSFGESLLSRFEPVIGLEVHCQLKTASKLFCGCSTSFGALPNHQTCPVCLGMPGVLPVLNEEAVNLAIKLALAVGSSLNETSVFARKQYFYPDLPKGYQITQFDLPYCFGGQVKLSNGNAVRLMRIHIEEDAGKNVHAEGSSYVDLNRAGIPLLEIVSQPDIRSAEDAADYLRRLRSLVRHLDLSDGNLEEGSFRCDANVSIKPIGEQRLGTRCEIKNLNSFKNIERAIKYEVFRQADILDSGGSIVQQTLLFDAASGKTQPMRSKEDSHDYRYFPDPDLKPLKLLPARIDLIKSSLPELPESMASRFITDYGITEYDASLLTSDRDLAAYFEETVRQVDGKAPFKTVANWIISEFLREVNQRDWDLARPPISAANMAELIALMGEGTISGKIAKVVFEEMIENDAAPKKIVERRGLVQVSDPEIIRALITKVLDNSPNQVAEYLSGKEKIYGYFVGQIMKECQGKMNPAIINELLKEELLARKS